MNAKSKDDRPARDPLKPPAFFRKVIAEERTALEREVKKGVAAVMRPVPRRCLQIAMAHYSAGDSIQECLRWLDQAATYKVMFFEKRQYQLGGYGDLIENLETLSAASLAGRGPELVDAYRRCKLQSQPVPRYAGLINQAFAVFKREPVKQINTEMEDLKKHGKDLATLAPLFKSVSDRDARAFAAALDNFLSVCWSKQVKGVERMEEYTGKWSILSAAVSKLMGGVPSLPDKTRPYVPADLVT